jgi:hypothetical protein
MQDELAATQLEHRLLGAGRCVEERRFEGAAMLVMTVRLGQGSPEIGLALGGGNGVTAAFGHERMEAFFNCVRERRQIARRDESNKISAELIDSSPRRLEANPARPSAQYVSIESMACDCSEWRRFGMGGGTFGA